MNDLFPDTPWNRVAEKYNKEMIELDKFKEVQKQRLEEIKRELFMLYSKNPTDYPLFHIKRWVECWKKSLGIPCLDYEFLYPNIIDFSSVIKRFEEDRKERIKQWVMNHRLDWDETPEGCEDFEKNFSEFLDKEFETK